MIIRLKKKNLFLLIIIGLFIILFHYLGILSPIEGLIIKGLNPVRRQIYILSRNMESYFHVIFNYNDVQNPQQG